MVSGFLRTKDTHSRDTHFFIPVSGNNDYQHTGTRYTAQSNNVICSDPKLLSHHFHLHGLPHYGIRGLKEGYHAVEDLRVHDVVSCGHSTDTRKLDKLCEPINGLGHIAFEETPSHTCIRAMRCRHLMHAYMATNVVLWVAAQNKVGGTHM